MTSPPSLPARPSILAKVSTLAMTAMVAGAVLRAVAGLDAAGLAAGGALLVYLAVEGPRLRGGGRRMLAFALAMVPAALALHPHPVPLLLGALMSAATLMGLFAALGMLREAAETSPLVAACGEAMVRQPPGRRYAVLALGSHLISVVLNFGVLPLLGTMVMRGNTLEAAGGDPKVAAIRKQRMMSALLRGFMLMTVWSPLSVSFAVTQSVVHGVPWMTLIPLQLALTALLMLLGWALDRHSFPPRPLPASPRANPGWAPLVKLGLLVAAVVALAMTVAAALGVKPVIGAMIAVPAAAMAWLTAQTREAGGAAVVLAGRRLAGGLCYSFPAFRNEVAMVGGAMFTGTVAGALIPPEAIAHLVVGLGLPPALLAVLIVLAVMALAQIGFSQIISVTLLGGTAAELARMGLDPLVLASGLMGAWALSTGSTPVGAAVLTVARIADEPVSVVTRRWNGVFVLAGAAVLALWMAALSHL